MDKELYSNLATAVEYFQYGEKFEELVAIEENKIQSAKDEFYRQKNKGSVFFYIFYALFILGIFVSVVGFIVSLVYLKQYNGSDPIAIKVYRTMAVVFLLMGIFSVFMVIVLHIKDKIHEAKFTKIYQKTVQPKIDAAEAEIANVENLVNEFVAENLHLIEFIPMQYRHMQAVSYMFYAVANKRADTLKEAINLYEEQLHRWNLENAAQAAYEAQEYMARAMDETNNRLQRIEAMQYWDYLNRKSNN